MATTRLWRCTPSTAPWVPHPAAPQTPELGSGQTPAACSPLRAPATPTSLMARHPTTESGHVLSASPPPTAPASSAPCRSGACPQRYVLPPILAGSCMKQPLSPLLGGGGGHALQLDSLQGCTISWQKQRALPVLMGWSSSAVKFWGTLAITRQIGCLIFPLMFAGQRVPALRWEDCLAPIRQLLVPHLLSLEGADFTLDWQC